MQADVRTIIEDPGDADEVRLLRGRLVVNVFDLLKFGQEIFHLKIVSARNVAVEFETPPDPAKDDSLLKAGLPKPCDDVLPASRAIPEIPASSERQPLRCTSESASASPCGEALPS